MKSALYITLLFNLFIILNAKAQKVENLHGHLPGPDWENIQMEKIADDSLCTTFLIWIKGGVKHHFHEAHSECIYILEGEGTMEFADQVFKVKAGDYVTVPKGIVHAVTASVPMHVLSIQTPQWKTDDRKFVEPFRRPHNE